MAVRLRAGRDSPGSRFTSSSRTTDPPRVGAADLLNPLPSVFAGLVLAAVLGSGLHTAAAALVAWVPLAVHTRNLADEVRASGYHEAAVAGGAHRGWPLRRHLLPAVRGPVAAHALASVPGNALAIASLGFLGLGAAHDTAARGAQLAAAMNYLERAPAAVATPVLGLTLLGLLAGHTPRGLAPHRAVDAPAEGHLTGERKMPCGVSKVGHTV